MEDKLEELRKASLGADYLINSSLEILLVAFPLFPFSIANVNIEVRGLLSLLYAWKCLVGCFACLFLKDIFVHNIQVENALYNCHVMTLLKIWLCFYLIVKIKVEQNLGCVSYLSTRGAGEAIWTRVQLPARGHWQGGAHIHCEFCPKQEGAAYSCCLPANTNASIASAALGWEEPRPFSLCS